MRRSMSGSRRKRQRIDQFRKLVARARSEGHVSASMLAQVAGQARILLGSMIRAAVLVPAPDYPEEFAWAFDVEAAALERGGFAVEPRPWTDPGDLVGFDLVLPLVAWGYQSRCRALVRLARPAGRRARSHRQSRVRLLRWNSHKSLSRGTWRQGHCRPSRPCWSSSSMRRRWPRPASRLRRRPGDQAADFRFGLWHAPAGRRAIRSAATRRAGR